LETVRARIAIAWAQLRRKIVRALIHISQPKKAQDWPSHDFGKAAPETA
jgi:hypothetical protein